jgi:hypothetical protein
MMIERKDAGKWKIGKYEYIGIEAKWIQLI